MTSSSITNALLIAVLALGLLGGRSSAAEVTSGVGVSNKEQTDNYSDRVVCKKIEQLGDDSYFDLTDEQIIAMCAAEKKCARIHEGEQGDVYAAEVKCKSELAKKAEERLRAVIKIQKFGMKKKEQARQDKALATWLAFVEVLCVKELPEGMRERDRMGDEEECRLDHAYTAMRLVPFS